MRNVVTRIICSFWSTCCHVWSQLTQTIKLIELNLFNQISVIVLSIFRFIGSLCVSLCSPSKPVTMCVQVSAHWILPLLTTLPDGASRIPADAPPGYSYVRTSSNEQVGKASQMIVAVYCCCCVFICEHQASVPISCWYVVRKNQTWGERNLHVCLQTLWAPSEEVCDPASWLRLRRHKHIGDKNISSWSDLLTHEGVAPMVGFHSSRLHEVTHIDLWCLVLLHTFWTFASFTQQVIVSVWPQAATLISLFFSSSVWNTVEKLQGRIESSNQASSFCFYIPQWRFQFI